jgi:hypothetical protein
VIGERMTRHGFVDRPCTSVAAAAAHTVAIQAQDLAQTRLGVRSRSATRTEAEVTAAIASREVVRTWLLRNTIHLVTADDLRWLVSLFGPMIRRRSVKRWTDLGLPPEVLSRAEALVPAVLADGPLTRHEVATGLAEHGLDISADQAPTHLLIHLGTIGMTCHADGNRFALLDDWLPNSAAGPRDDDALAELARRYYRAFSPATATDFTTWSGLAGARATALIRDELTPVTVHGKPGFRLGEEVDGGGVRLLSAFDNYLIGYRDRTGLVPADRRAEIYVGGIIRPVVLEHGAAVGRWRLDRSAGRVEISYFGRASRALRASVDAEIDDLARFVGRPLTLGGEVSGDR